MDEKIFSLIELLIARLERISADSIWAHRASGVKGSLLKIMEDIRNGKPVSVSNVKWLVEMGFSILKSAATEKHQ
jgi:hypothetical protein